jgi:hypothetical protein
MKTTVYWPETPPDGLDAEWSDADSDGEYSWRERTNKYPIGSSSSIEKNASQPAKHEITKRRWGTGQTQHRRHLASEHAHDKERL